MRSLAEVLKDVVARATSGPKRWAVVRTGPRDPIPWPIRLSVYLRDDYRCKTCGHRDDTRATLQLDHLLPWSAGGSDYTDNLRVLCTPCNQRRTNQQDGAEGRRLLPTTWWCVTCWNEPTHRPSWRDGTDLAAAPAVEQPAILAFCAWCRDIAHTDIAFTAGHYARLVSTEWSPTRGVA